MLEHLTDRATRDAIPIEPIAEGGLERWLVAPAGARAQLDRGQPLPGQAGPASPDPRCRGPHRRRGAGGAGARGAHGRDIWSYGGLPLGLPEATYRLPEDMPAAAATAAGLGWALGGYGFTRYKKPEREPARLVLPKTADKAAVRREAAAVFLVRDLVTTPAEDMGPAELADAARAVAKAGGARYSVIVGDELLKRNYPCIHAVGRASSRAPRLIDFRWGRRGPKVTLVGKGVCFDSGGLDLKGAANMQLMKKDMGGAAHVLGLAQMIMAAGLDLRLRVLIPAVENSVSSNAYRPLDIIRSRKGLTVEIGNTDAEGRVILCDALAEADGEKPDLHDRHGDIDGRGAGGAGPGPAGPLRQ